VAASRVNVRVNVLKGLGWSALSIAGWIPMYSIAKRALEHIDAFALGTLRYGLGAAVLAGLLLATEGPGALRYDGKLLPAIVLGIVGITGFNTLVWAGLTYTLPEHAALIVQMQAPLSALALWLLWGQRPAGFTLACVAAAVAGVAIVVTKGQPLVALSGVGGLVLLGDGLVFLGAVAWVIFALYATKFAGWSALRMTVLTCIPGSVGLVLLNAAAIGMGMAALPTAAALAEVGWQMVYFVLGSVVVAMLGFNAAARHIGPLNALLMLNVIPVGVFVIEAALGRSFSAMEIGGAALVVAALVANNLYLRGTSSSR
jgi:drug/metabolite transporter (DMT)-like permease